MRVGYLTLCQLNGSYAKGPNIGFVSVLAKFDYFGTHPIGTADVSPEPGIGVHGGGRNPEIGQFGITFLIEQNIGSFNIAMNFLARVEVVEAMEDRFKNGGNFELVEIFLGDLHDVGHTAGDAIFHNDPQIVIFKIGPIIPHNMVVIALFQDTYLHLIYAYLFLHRRDLHARGGREDFYRIQLTRLFMQCLMHAPIGALP